jgi:hypothetical protein
MSTPAWSRVVLADPGDINPIVLTVADLAYSWEVSNAGQLSCRIPAADLFAAGLDHRIGKWISAEHSTAGAWHGVVTDADLDISQGVWSLAAEHITHALLDARTTPRDYTQSSATAGGLVGQALLKTSRDSRLWVEDTGIDESGDILSYQWRGEPITSLISSLAGSEWEYRIREADRVFEWRRQLGVDRPDVELIVGRHITSGNYSESIKPVVNELLAVGDNRLTATSEAYVASDDDSIANYGLRQDSRFYPSVSSVPALKARAKADLPSVSEPPRVLQATVVDIDSCFARFREGDRIRVRIPAANATVSLRVKVRSLRADGTMAIAGDIEDGLT